VFVSKLVAEACQAASLEVLMLRPKHPLNIVCLCRVGKAPDSGPSADELSKIMRRSPFASDRANVT
jgi:hypothetical protein